MSNDAFYNDDVGEDLHGFHPVDEEEDVEDTDGELHPPKKKHDDDDLLDDLDDESILLPKEDDEVEVEDY